MQETLIKVAATLGVLGIVVAIVGFAVMPKDSPSLGLVRSASVGLIVLALLSAVAVGLWEVWS